MPTVNEILRDAAISHQIDITHYSNGEVRGILAILRRAEGALTVALADAIERLGTESLTARNVESKLASVRELLGEAYKEAGATLTANLTDFSQHELDYQMALFTAAIPDPVLQQISLAKVTVAQAREAAFRRPFQGRLLSEWMAGLEADAAAKVRDAVRMGIVEGQTTAEIVRRIRGTRAEGFKDGILEIARRNAEAVVRTAISHVSGTMRDSFYDANADLIQEVRWLSTLDGRTSQPCRLRDNLAYDAVTHRPIGHAVSWGAGPGRLHWQCRSSSYPVVKLWKELGISERDLPPATRASMDGQVPADTTYAEWLKGQSAERQDQVLGPTRGKLLRDGGLELDAFSNDRGRTLTLEQMRQKSPDAFRRAGL
ncbi:MAG: hypothetical protein WA154_10900 [Moraxellaceae bacterium]